MSAKKRKEPFGRPTKYNITIDAEICERLSLGESLTRICKDEKMPSVVSVYAWLLRAEHKDFLNRYIQARERQSDTYIDQCVDIADATDRDTLVLIDKNGEEYEKTNFEHINRSRLRVDTRIKIAEKMAPQKYTPRKALEHTGNVELSGLTDEQIQTRLEILLKAKKKSLPPIEKVDPTIEKDN